MIQFRALAECSGHSLALLVTLADQKRSSSCPPPWVPFMPLWETERKGSERWQLSNWTIKKQSGECGCLAVAFVCLSGRHVGLTFFTQPLRDERLCERRASLCPTWKGGWNGKREFSSWAQSRWLGKISDKGWEGAKSRFSFSFLHFHRPRTREEPTG